MASLWRRRRTDKEGVRCQALQSSSYPRQVGQVSGRDPKFGRGGAVRRWGPIGKPGRWVLHFLGHHSSASGWLCRCIPLLSKGRRVRRRSTCCLNSRTGRISLSVKALPPRENETSKDVRLPVRSAPSPAPRPLGH